MKSLIAILHLVDRQTSLDKAIGRLQGTVLTWGRPLGLTRAPYTHAGWRSELARKQSHQCLVCIAYSCLLTKVVAPSQSLQ